MNGNQGTSNTNKPPSNTVALYIVDDTTAAPPRTSEELTVAVGAEVDQQQSEQSTAVVTNNANVNGQENSAVFASEPPPANSDGDGNAATMLTAVDPDESGPSNSNMPSQLPVPAARMQKVASASEYAADLNEFEAFSTDNEGGNETDASSRFDGLEMTPNIVAEGINDDPNLNPALDVSFSRPNFVLAVESQLLPVADDSPQATVDAPPLVAADQSPFTTLGNVSDPFAIKNDAAGKPKNDEFANAVIAAPANPQWHEGQRPKTSRGNRNSLPAPNLSNNSQSLQPVPASQPFSSNIVEDIDNVRAFSAGEEDYPSPAATKPTRSSTAKSSTKSVAKQKITAKTDGTLDANKTRVDLSSGKADGKLSAEKQRRPKKETENAAKIKETKNQVKTTRPMSAVDKTSVNNKPVVSKTPKVVGRVEQPKQHATTAVTSAPKAKPQGPIANAEVRPKSSSSSKKPINQKPANRSIASTPAKATEQPHLSNVVQKRPQTSTTNRSVSRNTTNSRPGATTLQSAKEITPVSPNKGSMAPSNAVRPALTNKSPPKKPALTVTAAKEQLPKKQKNRVDIVSNSTDNNTRPDSHNAAVSTSAQKSKKPPRKKSLHIVQNKENAGRPKVRGKSVSREPSKDPGETSDMEVPEPPPRAAPKKIIFNPAPTNEDVRRDKNRKACKKAVHMIKRDKYLCRVVANKTRESAEAYNEQAKKRLGLSETENEVMRPFAMIPLTATVSESAGTRSPLLMRYPSFSARKANVGIIETFGAPEPRIRTPLTEALVADDKHWSAVEKLDEETNGANVHKRPRRIEDLYSMRVKKFWVRWQLLNTPFLQHLRRDQRYNDMQHHERNRTEAIHAANEHIIQHLYHLKTHPTRTLDNWNPKGFGWQVNMKWRYRQRAWRQLLEVNYRLFAHLLNVRPYYPSYDAYCRRSIDNLTYQMFITQQKRTKRLLMRRLKYEMKSLSKPEYEQGGPAWWRPLKKHEERAFQQIQSAYTQYCDEVEADNEKSSSKKADETDLQQEAIEDFVLAMRILCPAFVEFHLREALEALQDRKLAANKAIRKNNSNPPEDDNENLPMPLLTDLLYELRRAKPIKQAPYNLRSFLFVCIVRLTPPEHIRDIRIALKNFFTFRPPYEDYNIDRRVGRVSASESKRKQLDARSAQSKHIVCELRPLEVFTRTRDIRDALRPYHTPYGHIAMDWMVRLSSERRRRLLDEGPYQIDLRLREHRMWCRASMYTILKLPDYALLPSFRKLYKEPIDNYRPKEKTFLIKVFPRVE